MAIVGKNFSRDFEVFSWEEAVSRLPKHLPLLEGSGR